MPPTQQDLFRDRRQMIGYNNEEEVEVVARMDNGDGNDDENDDNGGDDYNEDDEHDDDQPFDCYNEEAALEAARRYSPWKDNTGKTVASVASPSKTPRRSKSRPWRVDVMLRKNKGVERATTTWKQQMKERKEVFQWSGVTVVEDQSEDSVFHGIEDDEISKGDTSDRAVIGTYSPSTSDLPEVIDCTEPEVIDCTEPLPDREPCQATPPPTGVSAIYDFQNAMRALEQQLQQDSEYIGDTGDNDDDDDDDDDLHSVYSVRSIASAIFPSVPERQEESRLESSRREVIQSLESTFTKGYDPYERYTITTMGRAGLDPPKQAKNEYHTVFQRFQRSRLAKELAMTVSLLPTKHFHVVEELTEAHIARLELETTKLTAPVVRSKYRVTTSEVTSVKQEAPVPEPAPTEAVVSTVFVPDQQKPPVPTVAPRETHVPVPPTPTTEAPGPTVLVPNQQELPIPEPAPTEPPVPPPAPTEAVMPTILEPKQEAQSEHSFISQDEGQFTTSISQEEKMDKPKIYDPSTVSHDLGDVNVSIAHDQSPSPPEGVGIEARGTSLTQQVDSEHVVETTANTAAPACHNLAPRDDGKSPNPQTQGTLSVPTTTIVSSDVAQSQDVAESQNDPAASQPIHSDPSPSVDDNAMTPTPVVDLGTEMTKKSKADKWKDRLAKRKSGVRRDSDISTESPAAPLATVSENNAPPPPETTQLDSDPTQVLPPSPPSADDTTPSKDKRKSMKWKQRLAEKKSSKSSPAPAQQQVLTQTAEATTPEPLKQIVEVPQIEDQSMEAAAEEAYKQLMGDLLFEHEPVASAVAQPTIQNGEVCPNDNEKALSPTTTTSSTKPTHELQDDSKPNNPKPAIQPAPLAVPKPVNLPTDLRHSFMAFDALLRQRQGDLGMPDEDADEYSEYTIEEVSVMNSPAPTKTEPVAEDQGEIAPIKSADTESLYEEITVEQSYMEFTVDDELESDDEDSHDSPKPTSTPVHPATTNLMNSRMFSTPQVAKEPTITVEHALDDEMTVLTFDQSYAEPIHRTPEAPSQFVSDRLNDSARTSVKETIAGGSGSMQGSRKRDSISGSNRSYGSRTSSTSDKSNKLISDVLRKDIWSRDVKVVEEALEAICMEASRGQKARSKISQFGGIMAIVRAMESHRHSELIQVAGCNALDRLALDPDTQVVIGEMGGIAVILDAMKAFDGSANVHQAACAALANITRHRGTTDEVSDAVQVLCASMGRHATNMQVQAKAFGAIANICMDNKQRLRELSAAGGMLTMTMALQQPWPNKAEKHEAISNLSILLRCMAEHEESGQEEEYEGYPDDGGDTSDLMSVISALEDDLLMQPLPTPQETNLVAKSLSLPKESSDVQCLQKIPRIDRSKGTVITLEQGSNSTQPTEPTSREHDDENCTIS